MPAILPSSFSSSFGAGASPAPPPVAAPPDGAAAAAPPPDPTFSSISLTFFPSSALSLSVEPLQSKPGMAPYLCEESRPYWLHIVELGGFDECLELVGLYDDVSPLSYNFPSTISAGLTVTSISSSARIRAAYETASSEVDIVRCFQVVYVYGGFVIDFSQYVQN